MKFLSFFRKKTTKKPSKASEAEQYSTVVQFGREQFKKLADKGLTIPVVLL